MSIVFTLVAISWLSLVVADNVPINPSKIQTNIAKMRHMATRSSFKQQQVSSAQVYLPKLGENTAHPLLGKINPTDHPGLPIFEIYVRKKAGGLWVGFQELVGVQDVVNTAAAVTEGGIDSELQRPILEKWLHTTMFGSGMGGDKVVANRVRELIPQFKKAKDRDMMYGYRQVQEDSSIWSMGIPASSELTSGPKYTMADLKAPSVLNGDEFDWEDLQVIDNQGRWSALSTTIDGYLSDLKALAGPKIDRFVACSDGSATPLMYTRGAFLCSAGVAISPVTLVDGEQWEVIHPPLLVRVGHGELIVPTPFDAELIGGLAALVVANLLSSKLSRLEQNGGATALPWSLLSDSRPLVRILKQLQEDHTEESSLSTSTTGYRDRITALIQKQLTTDSPLDFGIEAMWVAGHPERRAPQSEDWSDIDRLIWTADLLAKLSSTGSDIGASSSSYCSTWQVENNIGTAGTVVELDCLDILKQSSARG